MEPRKLVLDDQDLFVRYFVIALDILRTPDLARVKEIADLLPQKTRAILSGWAAKKSKEDVSRMSCQMDMVASLQQLCTMRRIIANEQLNETETRDCNIRNNKILKQREDRIKVERPLREVSSLNEYMILVSMISQFLVLPETEENLPKIATRAAEILKEIDTCRARDKLTMVLADSDYDEGYFESLEKGFDIMLVDCAPQDLYADLCYELTKWLVDKMIRVKFIFDTRTLALKNDLSMPDTDADNKLKALSIDFAIMKNAISKLNLSTHNGLRQAINSQSSQLSLTELTLRKNLSLLPTKSEEYEDIDLNEIFTLAISILKATDLDTTRMFHERLILLQNTRLQVEDDNLSFAGNDEKIALAKLLIAMVLSIYDYKRVSFRVGKVFTNNEMYLSELLKLQKKRTSAKITFVLVSHLVEIASIILSIHSEADIPSKMDKFGKIIDIYFYMENIVSAAELPDSSEFTKEVTAKLAETLKLRPHSYKKRTLYSELIDELQKILITELLDVRENMQHRNDVTTIIRRQHLLCMDAFISMFQLNEFPAVAARYQEHFKRFSLTESDDCAIPRMLTPIVANESIQTEIKAILQQATHRLAVVVSGYPVAMQHINSELSVINDFIIFLTCQITELRYDLRLLSNKISIYAANDSDMKNVLKHMELLKYIAKTYHSRLKVLVGNRSVIDLTLLNIDDIKLSLFASTDLLSALLGFMEYRLHVSLINLRDKVVIRNVTQDRIIKELTQFLEEHADCPRDMKQDVAAFIVEYYLVSILEVASADLNQEMLIEFKDNLFCLLDNHPALEIYELMFKFNIALNANNNAKEQIELSSKLYSVLEKHDFDLKVLRVSPFFTKRVIDAIGLIAINLVLTNRSQRDAKEKLQRKLKTIASVLKSREIATCKEYVAQSSKVYADSTFILLSDLICTPHTQRDIKLVPVETPALTIASVEPIFKLAAQILTATNEESLQSHALAVSNIDAKFILKPLLVILYRTKCELLGLRVTAAQRETLDVLIRDIVDHIPLRTELADMLQFYVRQTALTMAVVRSHDDLTTLGKAISLLISTKMIRNMCKDYHFDGSETAYSGFAMLREGNQVDTVFKGYIKLLNNMVVDYLLQFRNSLQEAIEKCESTLCVNADHAESRKNQMVFRVNLSYFDAALRRFNLSDYPALTSTYRTESEKAVNIGHDVSSQPFNIASHFSAPFDASKLRRAADMIAERLNWMEKAYASLLVMDAYNFKQKADFIYIFDEHIEVILNDINLLNIDNHDVGLEIELTLIKLVAYCYKLKTEPQSAQKLYSELYSRFSVQALIKHHIIYENLTSSICSLLAIRTEIYLCESKNDNRDDNLAYYIMEVKQLIDYADVCDKALRPSVIRIANEYFLMILRQLKQTDEIEPLKKLKPKLDALPVSDLEKQAYRVCYQFITGSRLKGKKIVDMFNDMLNFMERINHNLDNLNLSSALSHLMFKQLVASMNSVTMTMINLPNGPAASKSALLLSSNNQTNRQLALNRFVQTGRHIIMQTYPVMARLVDIDKTDASKEDIVANESVMRVTKIVDGVKQEVSISSATRGLKTLDTAPILQEPVKAEISTHVKKKNKKKKVKPGKAKKKPAPAHKVEKVNHVVDELSGETVEDEVMDVAGDSATVINDAEETTPVEATEETTPVEAAEETTPVEVTEETVPVIIAETPVPATTNQLAPLSQTARMLLLLKSPTKLQDPLIKYQVNKFHQLLRQFSVELSELHMSYIESFFALGVDTYLCGTSVCSAIYKRPLLSLELTCFADTKYMLALLTMPENREYYAIKEAELSASGDKITIRLDEEILTRQERAYKHNDLLIEIYCLPYQDKKSGFEYLCRQQAENTMIFYDFTKERLLDFTGNFSTIAVYPRLHLDARFNVAPMLDIQSSSPGNGCEPAVYLLKTISKLANFAHYHMGIGAALENYIRSHAITLSQTRAQTFSIELFDQLFLSGNALATCKLLEFHNLLHYLFPAVTANGYVLQRFRDACYLIDTAFHQYKIASMSAAQFAAQRTEFLFNAFYIPLLAVKDCITFFLPDGDAEFADYADKFFQTLPFEFQSHEDKSASEAFTMRCWKQLCWVTITGHYQQFVQLHPNKKYEEGDRDTFLQDMTKLMERYPQEAATYIAELAWNYHTSLTQKTEARMGPGLTK